MSQKYCAYCRLFRDPAGFIERLHGPSKTRRSMCPGCQKTREKPRGELQRLADAERDARKKGSK